MKEFVLNQVVVWLDPDNGLATGLYKIIDILNDETFLLRNENFGISVSIQELRRCENVYVCPTCGDYKIEFRTWTEMNTHKFIMATDESQYWCPKCTKHVYPPNTVAKYHSDEIKLLTGKEL